MTPGLVAFLVALAVLTAMYALFAPTRTVETTDPVRKPGEVPGLFDKWVRPAMQNLLTVSPSVLGSYARGSTGIASVLVRSGNPWKINAEEYVAVKIIAAAVGAAGFALLASTGMFVVTMPVGMVMGAGVGWMVPGVLLGSQWSKRRKELNRTLPEALDMLRISMNAGYNFTNALNQVVRLMPPGATQVELARVVADLRAGMTLNTALEGFASRIPTDQVEAFVRAVIIAQTMGTDMAMTLSAQANEARAEYERVVEVKAQKLQTTLFLPIIGLFLPALMVFIFGPALSDLGSF